MISFRPSCEAFYVDVRVTEIHGRFLASADTPDGPTTGVGHGAIEAVTEAPGPFDGAIEDLLASLQRGIVD